MTEDPIKAARELVTEMFPQARWALLTGSVITSQRTAGSDLDIVVLLPDGDPDAPHRESRYHAGWPVELFVHDDATLAHYLARDGRRPSLHRMVATGIALVGDPSEWQQTSTRVMAAGPAPLTDDERAGRRYSLTDQLDDLTHATDPGERAILTAATWIAAAELALATARHWTGQGKWLLRELRDLDNTLADRWVAAHGDPAAVMAFGREVLNIAGGPLFAGYHVGGQHPHPNTDGAGPGHTDVETPASAAI